MLIYSSKNYIGVELSLLSSFFSATNRVVVYHYLKDSTWLVDLRPRTLPLSILQDHRVTFSIYATEPLC